MSSIQRTILRGLSNILHEEGFIFHLLFLAISFLIFLDKF